MKCNARIKCKRVQSLTLSYLQLMQHILNCIKTIFSILIQSDSDSDADSDKDEDKYAEQADMPGTKFDSKMLVIHQLRRFTHITCVSLLTL